MCLHWLSVVVCLAAPLIAQQDVETIRRLVEQGALPQSKLAEAEEMVRDSEDRAVLSRYLYGSVRIEDLEEAEISEMIAAAERLRNRQLVRLDTATKLVEQGAAPRNSLRPLREELERRQDTLLQARLRQRLLVELAEFVRNEQLEADYDTRSLLEDRNIVAIRFDGDGEFTHDDWRRVVLAYERRFSRSIPVSANGPTRLHRSMGLDHRGRIDVALSPDQSEGVWLRRFLESEKIPYFAFRRHVPGKATAPHIHLGPPSTRLRAAD